MTGFEIKGWCPGALRPMLSGDGLVVRVRPRGGRLTTTQALAIARLAREHGNGRLDLSSRANLQIRGVRTESQPALTRGLAELGLLDHSPEAEGERNVLVSPFWSEEDGTLSLASGLEAALEGERLGLPAKFGFAIDCGAERVLASAAADIRVERGEGGGLIVRADGAATGRAVLKSECIPLVLSLARWFVATASAHERRGRMAQVLACGTALPDELNGHVRPIPCAAQPLPGLRTAGALVGLAFGQLEAGTLERLAGHGDGLRLTPWRLVLIEGATGMPRDGDLITRSDDPLLRVVACTGAPGCPQALGATRPFARRLAPSVPEGQIVHIAGCAKGCAHPAPATVTLVATRSGFDLVRNGKASSAPVARSLTEDELLRHASNMAEAV